MVVAIDGPAGAGKSTVARETARALGFGYLDSGAMYRAVALSTLEKGGDPAEHAAAMDIELGERVLLDGRDVTEAIREPQVSEVASQVATRKAVREALVGKQRQLLESGDWVGEGRDIGTVVAPEAPVKIYLQADPAVRARRRQAERPDIGADALATDMRLRDQSDAARMEPAPDAVRIDTTELDVEEVVEQIESMVRSLSAA